jgi:VWFA-related protein
MRDILREGNEIIRLLAALITVLVSAVGASAQDAEPAPITSVRITSPLGRTGLAGVVRIVAQVHAPPGVTSPVRFFVDGALVGTATAGPPFAVEWADENPFERREIVAETEDPLGRTVRDTIALPAFEITDVTEVTSVLLEAGVYDKTGRFMSQLTPDAFRVTENGVPQSLDLVTREAMPTTLLLLVDNSRSMSRRMEFVHQAAGRLATSLRPMDKLIVAPFTSHIESVTGPTTDRGTIVAAIDAMQASGGTAIFDSLLDAVQLLDGIEGRRAVVLITDGYDEISVNDVDTALTAAARAQITVYVVGIGGVAGISLKGETTLRRVADQTGGRVFFPPREIDLVPVSEAVATDSHSRYLLTYTPSDQNKDGTWRGITVSVADGYRVRTRAGYFAPKPPPIRPTVEFTATDRQRAYVSITADDLEVLEDGVPQTVDTFQEAVDPVSIVMAVDGSGSMKKSAEAVREAANTFVDAVRAEDKLALITFSDKPSFAHLLSTNRDWSRAAIAQYQTSGGTALYDALWNSVMHLKPEAGRRAIVLLTDGRDENNPGTGPGSEHSLEDVLTLNKSVGATIFAIGLGTKVDRAGLERLAQETGGDAYFPATGGELADQYRQVVENLRRRYVLSYTSTHGAHDGSWRAVQIVPRMPGVQVKTLGGYFAPEPRDAAGRK